MTETTLKPGTAIGHYVIASVLLKDRQGITYIATDTTSVSGAEKVRIREVFPEILAERVGTQVMAGDSEQAATVFSIAIQTALRLSQTLSRIDHPSIPRVRDAFDFNGTFYTVLEEPDGETYASLLLKQGPLPSAQIKSLLMILLPALEALHEAGLVHGRLSATSIVRLDDGYPSLTGIETAAFQADASSDVKGLGEACDMLWTAGSGLNSAGASTAHDDLRLARAVQGAARLAGAPPIMDLKSFRKLALKSAPLAIPRVSKPVLFGVSAAVIAAAAAASIVPRLDQTPDALVLERVQVVNGAVAQSSEDPFAVKAQTVSLREMIKTPAGLPATTPSAAWASLDRNEPAELRAFLSAFSDSDQGDLAAQRLELLDERLWLAAEKAGTREALEAYLKAFKVQGSTDGAHVVEAERALKRFSKSHSVVIADVRRLLTDLGYDAGKGDGETPALKRAIRRFEKDESLSVTGEATAALVTALEEAARTPVASTVIVTKTAAATPVTPTTVQTTPVNTATPGALPVIEATSVSAPAMVEPVNLAPVEPPKPAPPPRKVVRTPATMPAKLKPLTYPARARELNEEGISLVKACVEADGGLLSARIAESSGSKRLDSAALDWVSAHSRFVPATADGEAVDGGCFQVPVEWKINK